VYIVSEESSIRDQLVGSGDRAAVKTQAEKKNYAEVLSRLLAQRFADALRSRYQGILPERDGQGHESRARTAKGFKKLDVNYSTLELGLALGISIKTINFRDAKTGRYTKNFTRVDNELRAEAADYHQRQPYAVMVGLVFLPADACDDGGKSPSSFGQAVKVLRYRAGRVEPDDDPTLFEGIYVGLYSVESRNFGEVGFFDVEKAPPKHGTPRALLTFEQLLDAINGCYERRNRSTFIWADEGADTDAPEIEVDDD
jgi:hypothetical protein